jgi:hypothetical protein
VQPAGVVQVIMAIPHFTILLKVLKLLGTLARYLIGFATIWIALFLKVTAEGVIQNRLERLSKAVDAKQGSALSKAARFVRVAARLTANGFDALFGSRLMSLRMVGVSFCLSVASFLLAISLLNHFSPKPAPVSAAVTLLPWLFLYLVLAIVPAALPAIADNVWLLRLWAIVVIFPLYKLIGILVYGLYQGGHPEMAVGIFIIAACSLAISVLIDVGYIWATRWMLRRVDESRDLSSMLILIFGSVLLAAVLIVLVPFLAYEALSVWPTVGVLTAVFVLMMNLLDVLVCSAIFVSAFLMMVHRLLWPFVDGLAYALQRYHILQQKTLLFTIGVAVILVPTDSFWLGVKYVIKAAMRVLGIPAL